MEIMDYIRGNEVIICTVALLAGLTLYGHRRGLIHMAVSIGSLIVTLFIADRLLPYMENILINNVFIKNIMAKWNEGLSEKIGEAEYSPLYDILGMGEICDKAGELIFGFLAKGVAFLILFVFIFVIIRILGGILDIFARLPIIYGMNQIGGALIGFAEALFIIWMVMLFISFFPGGNLCSEIMRQIYRSEFLLYLYKSNIILRFLTAMLQVMVI